MYDGTQYDSYSFIDADTVMIDTCERDYFDPDFTSIVSSETVSLEKAIGIWVRHAELPKDGGYNLYNQYFQYRERFGEEGAARFKALVSAAGGEIDDSIGDLSAFIHRRMERAT